MRQLEKYEEDLNVFCAQHEIALHRSTIMHLHAVLPDGFVFKREWHRSSENEEQYKQFMKDIEAYFEKGPRITVTHLGKVIQG